ncbi:TetR/AcrR family transcriptional regulator [Virgibacillus oceani]|uniref:TetR family transcriptional regulator n=1 Tax=Virgibacillus oceani TaxID=1479511 RepID=A0A917HHB4_9BACI|nr:TetR/AcrR family transcriptional regulator [Virgibacillus oceani]GGG79267.1 TetR family transcriptional regulator [Virgibacillus oceani]
MSKNDTRYKILIAAADIVQTDGILDLTLEAAAEKAGVSKGGLLYHFPSKDALIEGMVEFLMKNYAESIKMGAEQDLSQTGKWTRAFIKETFLQSTSNRSMDAGLMAAAAINPNLLKPVQDAYEEWQNHIEHDGLDPILATVLRLAVDGLWFSEIFGLAPLEDNRRKLVLERLIQLTQDNEE